MFDLEKASYILEHIYLTRFVDQLRQLNSTNAFCCSVSYHAKIFGKKKSSKDVKLLDLGQINCATRMMVCNSR